MNTAALVGRVERVFNAALNAAVIPLTRSPLAPLLRPFLTTITYVGRRSGNTFSTPVLYRKHGDSVVIHVASPASKTWWRNFLGEGAPLTLQLPGGAHTGHAVSRYEGRFGVTVHVTLHEPITD